MADNNKNITEFSVGLNQDSSPINQPKGSYRFALNTIRESEEGDERFRSNEEANIECAELKPGYIPIGKCYITNNTVIIFSISQDETISEIGILDDNCNYVAHVNDEDSDEKDKLGFKLSNQIQATYRLRKGCERTVYFVDPKPRYYNFDKPNQFKINGNWSADNFSLRKNIKVFPTIDKVSVLDNSGDLTPGSYTILVQHLDEDFNGTEYYELVKDIKIYNDPSTKNFSDIEGSSNIGNAGEPYKYSKTSKVISISLDAVDTSFSYVRFAFVERTSGQGLVSAVKYSEPISINSPVFTYTGDNASTNGTIEEVQLFNINAGIDTAKHIEQIDNMLILSNVAGVQANMCKLQKYASKITVDCFIQDTILTTIKDQHNPKNPLSSYYGEGYQPGDIYSEGIQYVFEDYTVSPVCHIPGKSSKVGNSTVFSPGALVYPMSNINNSNSSETYIDENSSCNGLSYWGKDSQGEDLKNKNVRHHRFPTRNDVNVNFVTRIETNGGIATFKKISLTLLGDIKKTTDTYTAVNFSLKVKFVRNGVQESFIDSIYPDSNNSLSIIESNVFENSDSISNIEVYYIEEGSIIETLIPLLNNESELQNNGLIYKIATNTITENDITSIYKVPIFGLKFSNVELPPEDEIGKKIIGYQIVRQERRDNDKNILDSGVVFPMLKSGRNVSTGLLAPEYFLNPSLQPSTCEGSEDGTFPTCYNISKRNVMLVTPGHKFMDKTYDGFTTIEQVGNFEKEYVARSGTSTQNIYEGTSATGDEDKKTDDDDGYTLRHGYRFTGVKYKKTEGVPLNINNSNSRVYNLNAVNYAESEDGNETLYNLACDNKALVISSNEPGVDIRTYRPGKHHFPYVYIKKDNSSFYQNFRTNPYYLSSTEVFNQSTCKVFGGDTVVSPLRYSNHIFGNGVAALRRKKISGWALIGSIVTVLVSVFLIVISGGLATGGALVLAGGILGALGGILTGTAALIEVSKFTEIYADKWQNNLDKTVFDFIYARLFVREYPNETLQDYEPDPHHLSWKDDTFRWFGDIVGDLWFESTLNMSLRVPPTNMENNYLKPLKSYMGDRTSQLLNLSVAEYITNNSFGSGRFHRYLDPNIALTGIEEFYFFNKITKTDSSSSTNKNYTGISLPQVYLINPDFYITTGIKKYYTLPIEYDCCSECVEKFPHRNHYSLQSFQEEKSDNYRMFLPNNYRDIEGETGVITNIFRLYNNLFVHTEEALWQMGRNYQERVTDNVVSFIGTGSYFEIPPQKILDDDTGSSAGTRHKWSSLKTPNGYFFVSENQKKIYQFDGKQLKPISNIGLNNWFKNNLQVNLDKEFLRQKGYEYPNRDNPSNPIGTGFISTYDSEKERVIFTKKDSNLNFDLINPNIPFCNQGGVITTFPNFNMVIQNMANSGWTYIGIENCKLKFIKTITTITVQTIIEQVYHDAVYEDVVDTTVSWVDFISADVGCSSIGSSNCYDYMSLEDIDNVLHEVSNSTPLNSSDTLYLSINNYVANPILVNYVTGSQVSNETISINEAKTRIIKTLVSEAYVEEITREVEIPTDEYIYEYIDGEIQIPVENEDNINYSWTISYSLEDNSWTSWHSYLPDFYINVPEKFYSWKNGNNNFWKHNVKGVYQTFYNKQESFILDYVSSSNQIETMICDDASFILEAKKYDQDNDGYYDVDQFFNKVIFYNSRQCSGLLNIVRKDNNNKNYLSNQVKNLNVDDIIVDRTDRNWNINSIRDIRTDYNSPIWSSKIEDTQSNYYIDKILNTDSMNFNKDWSELESFRDKYLSVRLIFDKFVDTKLIMNFSNENVTKSFS